MLRIFLRFVFAPQATELPSPLYQLDAAGGEEVGPRQAPGYRLLGAVIVQLMRSTDALRLKRPVDYQLGVNAAEVLGDVAVPADRPVCGKNFRQLFRPDVFPLRSPAIGRQQGGRMVQVMERTDGFVTEHAIFPFIPLSDQVPNQAILWIHFQLL